MNRIIRSQQQIATIVALAVVMAAAGILTPGTALANGCNLPGHPKPQVDRILSGIINEDLVIEDKVCIGSTDENVTEVNGSILIKPGGVVKIGGKEKPATVNGDITVESGGQLTVRDLVTGDILAKGKSKVKLAFLARVDGTIIHQGGGEKPGSVDFKGGPNENGDVVNPITAPGAQVRGDIIINGGAKIKASGPNEANFIQGDLICDEDSKVKRGTAGNWDGTGEDGDAEPEGFHPESQPVLPKGHDHARDGIIGGDYLCAK